MAGNNYSNDDQTNTLKQLDQQGAEYWLRAAQWNSQDAACLLLGTEPRGFDGRKQLTYMRETRINSILDEIRHVKGDGVSYFWDRWPPGQWLLAARKAQIPVHPAFDAALDAVLAELKAIISAADETQKPQEDRPPPNLPMGLQVGTEATAPGQDAPAAVQRAPAPAQGQEEAVERSSTMGGIPKPQEDMSPKAATELTKQEKGRARITEIIERLKKIDATFNHNKMPGKKAEFKTFCERLSDQDKKDFGYISVEHFGAYYLAGLCKFGHGTATKRCDYYENILPKWLDKDGTN